MKIFTDLQNYVKIPRQKREYNCDECGKKFPSLYKLKRQLANIHDIGVVWNYCENCDYKCKDKYNLKKHLAQVHDIGVTWYPCDIEGCTIKPFKSSSDLKRHKKAVHEINPTLYPCDLCDVEPFKTNSNLQRHIRTVHEIGTIYYPCAECDYQAKSKKTLESHYDRNHNPNPPQFCCNVNGCRYSSVSNSDVYRHKQGAHNLIVNWNYCPVKGCVYKSKRKFLLKDHLSYRHDIGDKECGYCLQKCYKLTSYKQGGIISHICCTCLRKVTGKDSSIEMTMSNYLDKHFGSEFLLASDQRISGEACQTYRPDKLYAGPKLVLHVECDEYQHRGSHYSCDEKRISDIYDEFPGKKYVVIR